MSATDASTYEGFSADERAAMKEHAQEQKKAARRGSRADKAAEAERDLLAKIAEMGDSDRIMAERVHAVVTAAAPHLAPKLWYGMPAYALDGKVLCFFQSAAKFKARYATLGFNDPAKLDEGTMWPTAFALTEVTPEVEERIAALVKQAVSWN
ncbi:iron chaperone [Streptomyces sp. NPDC003719]